MMAGPACSPVEAAPAATPDCLICGTALSGPLAVLFRAAGVSRSSRNPNLCNRCNTHTEEGRLVELTVIFADLSSFTELTQALGPERTHEVVDAFLRAATAVLVKHGAFIDKYVGDAIMAFFNAPIRHEDHAARAVAAGQELQAELPRLAARFELDLRASIGIATGWARVGRLGSSDGKDYTAIGDVVNLAARLEAKARSGEIMVDSAAFRQVADHFPNLAPEALELKGFRDPVPAYRLSAAAPAAAPAAPVGDAATGRAGRRRAVNVGSVIFAILGAPCAAVGLIGPLAVVLSLGTAFGALATSVLSFLDASPVRIPLLTLAVLGGLANLYTVWHARRLRAASGEPERSLPPTRLERRRTATVLASAALTFVTVGYELYAHQFVTHHPWP